jgi:hypothetical protein
MSLVLGESTNECRCMARLYVNLMKKKTESCFVEEKRSESESSSYMKTVVSAPQVHHIVLLDKISCGHKRLTGDA